MNDPPGKSWSGAKPSYRTGVLALVWLAGALYVWHYLYRGWWPNNAGAFALSAERVLHGELPHRDFDEIYTGGLNYYHALAFKVLGTELASLRWAVFLVFLTWIPSVYYLATRFAKPWVSAIVTSLAVTWSLPIYSEPIASWYNLFLATHGVAAIIRHFETGRRRWLFIAGALGGLSCLAKIVGLYFIAAAGLALVFREQSGGPGRDGRPVRPARGTRSRSLIYTGFLTIVLFLVVAVIAIGVHRDAGGSGVVNLVLPVALPMSLIIWNEFTTARSSDISRFLELGRLVLPFVAGFAVVLVPFLLPYFLSGSLDDLARGLFISPQARFDVTSTAPPQLSILALPAVVALSVRWRPPKRVAILLAISPLPALALFVWQGAQWPNYAIVVMSLRALVPVAVMSGILLLLRHKPSGTQEEGADTSETALHSTKVFALLATAGFCALIQFPQSEEIYIFFVAPLALLALLAVFSYQGTGMLPVFVVGLLFYLSFTVLWINRSIHDANPVPRYIPDHQTESFTLERARGIRVLAHEKAEYETLITFLRERWPGQYILATPDCSEVYFLAGARNPTRITYDFFDTRVDRTARIRSILEELDIMVVVLNRRPQYSAAVDPALESYLRERYPLVLDLPTFQVRWRSPPQFSDESLRSPQNGSGLDGRVSTTAGGRASPSTARRNNAAVRSR